MRNVIQIILCITVAVFTCNAYSQEVDGGKIALEIGTFWDNNNIDVCWERDGYNEEKTWVRTSIEDTWQRNSLLKFNGWGRCGKNSNGIRIAIDDFAWPHVIDFGKRLSGRRDGIVFSFKFKGEFKCPKVNREQCIRTIAVHEFGHAIGFHHEQNRTDRPMNDYCVNETYQGDVPDQFVIAPYDEHSIMNYCRPSAEVLSPSLSKNDIISLQRLYGAPGVELVDIKYPHAPAAYRSGQWMCDEHFGKNLGGNYTCYGINCFTDLVPQERLTCMKDWPHRLEEMTFIKSVVSQKEVRGQTGQWWCKNHFEAQLGGPYFGGKWDCVGNNCDNDTKKNARVFCKTSAKLEK